MPQTDLHSFTLIYLGGMFAMAIISPVINILAQIIAFEIIKKVQAARAARNAVKQHATDNNTGDSTLIP